MEKYKEPQIYVVNNDDITKSLGKYYYVETGDLGTRKKIEYDKYVDQRYVNLSYNIFPNYN